VPEVCREESAKPATTEQPDRATDAALPPDAKPAKSIEDVIEACRATLFEHNAKLQAELVKIATTEVNVRTRFDAIRLIYRLGGVLKPSGDGDEAGDNDTPSFTLPLGTSPSLSK
jgi:hypothetical protein